MSKKKPIKPKTRISARIETEVVKWLLERAEKNDRDFTKELRVILRLCMEKDYAKIG